jgi:hypothetical protein
MYRAQLAQALRWRAVASRDSGDLDEAGCTLQQVISAGRRRVLIVAKDECDPEALQTWTLRLRTLKRLRECPVIGRSVISLPPVRRRACWEVSYEG